MSHYWERSEETAQAMRNGWLHTGDVGTVDAAGFFTIVDRIHAVISTGPGVDPDRRAVREFTAARGLQAAESDRSLGHTAEKHRRQDFAA